MDFRRIQRLRACFSTFRHGCHDNYRNVKNLRGRETLVVTFELYHSSLISDRGQNTRCARKYMRFSIIHTDESTEVGT